MTIIGFNFTKISAERGSPAKGKISINRKCNPTSVEEVKLGTGQRALKYGFVFSCEYEPKVADMQFSGFITELTDDAAANEALKSWSEKKLLPPQTLEKVMNGILNRCHVQALVLAKELNIPPPFNLPQVRVQQTKQATKKTASKKE